MQPNIKIRDESLIINLIGREEFDKYTEKRKLIAAKSKAEEERLQQLKMRIPKPENTINLNSVIYAMDQQNTKNKYSMEIDKK